MRAGNEIESVIEQITELSDDAQADLIQSILIMHAEHRGLYALDEES